MPKDVPAAVPAWPKAVAAYCAGTGGLGSWARAVATVTAANTSNAARDLNFNIAFSLIIGSKLHSGALTPARNRGAGDLPNLPVKITRQPRSWYPPEGGIAGCKRFERTRGSLSSQPQLCCVSHPGKVHVSSLKGSKERRSWRN